MIECAMDQVLGATLSALVLVIALAVTASTVEGLMIGVAAFAVVVADSGEEVLSIVVEDVAALIAVVAVRAVTAADFAVEVSIEAVSNHEVVVDLVAAPEEAVFPLSTAFFHLIPQIPVFHL